MDIRLIATDLDGTLLNDAKHISPRSYSALETAAARGILIVPSTGRIYGGMPDEVRDLPFVKYVLTVNGAGVYDVGAATNLYEANIPCEEAVRLCDSLRRYHTMYDCYLGGHGYMEKQWYAQIDTYCRGPYRDLVRRTRTPVDDLAVYIREHGDVQKMQLFFTDMELRTRMMKEIAAEYPDMAVTSSVENNVEINTARANKGEALSWLCHYLGIDMSQTAAFGDGSNDITMLRMAGTGVAMANACDEAKAAADLVTGDNESDGVAEFIEKYILA